MMDRACTSTPLAKYFPSLLISCLFLFSCAHRNPYEEADSEERKEFKPAKIPLAANTAFKVIQGAYGRYTHNTKDRLHRWELSVPFGTQVLAASDGQVELVRSSPLRGACDLALCSSVGTVWIKHRDGSVGIYEHLKPAVRPGQFIQEGERLGVSNLSGCICEPKIAFSVQKSLVEKETLPLYFYELPDGLLRGGTFGRTPMAKKPRSIHR